MVWIISADHWPRALLRAELIERGFEAIGFVEIRDAVIELIRSRSRRPRVVVVDPRDRAIDEHALAPLVEAAVPLLAIAGALQASDATLRRISWVEELRLPIAIGQIADAVERHTGARALSSSAPGARDT
jgi:hypothetical protein